ADAWTFCDDFDTSATIDQVLLKWGQHQNSGAMTGIMSLTDDARSKPHALTIETKEEITRLLHVMPLPPRGMTVRLDARLRAPGPSQLFSLDFTSATAYLSGVSLDLEDTTGEIVFTSPGAARHTGVILDQDRWHTLEADV